MSKDQTINLSQKTEKLLASFFKKKRNVMGLGALWIFLAIGIFIYRAGLDSLSSGRRMFALLLISLLGLVCLEGGIQGIRDRKVYVRSGYAMGEQAVITGYIYIIFSIACLFILYYVL